MRRTDTESIVIIYRLLTDCAPRSLTNDDSSAFIFHLIDKCAFRIRQVWRVWKRDGKATPLAIQFAIDRNRIESLNFPKHSSAKYNAKRQRATSNFDNKQRGSLELVPKWPKDGPKRLLIFTAIKLATELLRSWIDFGWNPSKNGRVDFGKLSEISSLSWGLFEKVFPHSW